MPDVNNIDHMRKWFRACPALSADCPFRVDYKSEEPVEYSIISMPNTLRSHPNVLGEEVFDDIQRMMFTFASNEFWGGDERQNIANFGFYQDITNWIIQQNREKNFPLIDGGYVTAVKPTLSQYVSAPGTDSAIYQIQIEVTYKLR